MRADAVLVLPPLLDDNAGFPENVEHLAIEEFIPQLRIEALAIAVLLRTAGSMYAVVDPTAAIQS